jgi:hypothetical protein
MKRIWLAVIFAVIMLTGWMVALGPFSHYHDFCVYYGYGCGHEHENGYWYEYEDEYEYDYLL